MKYVVAVNRKEAEELADVIGWDTKREAEAHLKEVQAPPTDPYYAQQYRVYEVRPGVAKRLTPSQGFGH
jgi:hypothetical protein